MSGYQPQGEALPALVAAAQRGDRESFAQIYDHFQLPVYRYAVARLRSPADAEDATAETFVAAFRTIGRFRWQGVPFDAWLFRIARSKITDIQRRRIRHGGNADLASVDPGLLPHAPDTAGEVVRADEVGRMLTAMRTLTGDHQDVLALRFFAGLSLQETAEALGRSANAVKQLQFRALNALRTRMRPDR